MIIPRVISSVRIPHWFWIGAICFVSLLIRLPSIDVPYYQDEWKNVHASAQIDTAGAFFAHPPLMQMVFVGAYSVFGPDYFRLFSLIFSIGTIILVYLVMKGRGQPRVGLYAAGLLGVCFYNILGSVMPDVDGSLLPFFFLAALYAYDRWNESVGSMRRYWFALFIAMLLVGFLLKLSFIIVVGVFVCDYAWQQRKSLLWKKGVILGASLVGFVSLYALIVYGISILYPAFDISIMFGHANQFAENVGRNWIQIAVQGLKAIFYLSPLLLAPLVFVSKDALKKSSVWLIYLTLGSIFYFIVFDFSRGALDKYLMYMIVPLAVLCGQIIAEVCKNMSRKDVWQGVMLGTAVSVILLGLNFLSHEVLALYPKTLWFSRVFDGQWLMLNPFNGGSGPMGFYVSFLFLASSFIVSLCAVAAGYFKRSWRATMLLVICMIGLLYNGVMAEEYMYGKINGSAGSVLGEVIAFIDRTPNIEQVITYNDIGTRELSERGLYAGRFYAAPQFEETHRTRFREYRGRHYMVIGVPPLYKGFYSEFFSQCDILFGSRSVAIQGTLFRCP